MSVQDYNKHIASMIDDSVRKYLQNELNIVNGNKTIRGGGSFPHSKPLPIFATLSQLNEKPFLSNLLNMAKQQGFTVEFN